jgi:hypothetical protein
MKQLFFPIVLFLTLFSNAQEVFTQQQFFDVVKAYHPVARQAVLGVDMARADITAARGGFDPLVQSDWNQKEFKGTQYYDHRVHP